MANIALIKIAASTAQSKTGRKIIIGVLIFFFIIILLMMSCVAGLLSIFSGSGLIKKDFDGQNTGVYQVIRGIYSHYVQGERDEMTELSSKYEQENMDYEYVTEYNSKTQKREPVKIINPESGKEEMLTNWFCTVDIDVAEYEHQSMVYVMAYLSCKHKADYLISGGVNIDDQEVQEFWNKVGGDIAVKYTDAPDENSKAKYDIYNNVLSAEEIAKLLFDTEQEQKEYLESVKMISQFIGEENF